MTRIAELLDVDDVDSPTMIQARNNFPRWVEQDPRLAVVDDLLALRRWTINADPAERDTVLLALAKLGSPSGGDDNSAVTALVWLLFPGVERFAFAWRHKIPVDVDQFLATNLWMAAKSIDWKNRRWVATCVIREACNALVKDAEVADTLAKKTYPIALTPDTPVPGKHLWAQEPDDSADQLLEILDEAEAAGVLTAGDRSLLIDLAILADRSGAPARRGRCGLGTAESAEIVATRWGVSPRTVRRRAARKLDDLAAFATARNAASPVSTHPPALAFTG